MCIYRIYVTLLLYLLKLILVASALSIYSMIRKIKTRSIKSTNNYSRLMRQLFLLLCYNFHKELLYKLKINGWNLAEIIKWSKQHPLWEEKISRMWAKMLRFFSPKKLLTKKKKRTEIILVQSLEQKCRKATEKFHLQQSLIIQIFCVSYNISLKNSILYILSLHSIFTDILKCFSYCPCTDSLENCVCVGELWKLFVKKRGNVETKMLLLHERESKWVNKQTENETKERNLTIYDFVWFLFCLVSLRSRKHSDLF